MICVRVLHVADAKSITWARRRRAATITALFALIAGFAWLLAAAPPFVAFGLAVTSAVAWCMWLEKHPEAQTIARPLGVRDALRRPSRARDTVADTSM
jgi:hypothetical protein